MFLRVLLSYSLLNVAVQNSAWKFKSIRCPSTQESKTNSPLRKKVYFSLQIYTENYISNVLLLLSNKKFF